MFPEFLTNLLNPNHDNGPRVSARFSKSLMAFIFAATLSAVNGACAQNPATAAEAQSNQVNIEAFDGYESWPMVRPGDMKAANAALKDQRIYLDAKFPGAQGPGGPLEETNMLFDVSNVYFKGKPALWIQWTSSSREGGTPGTASVDYLVVDRKTYRTLHRVQAAGGQLGPQTWSSPIVVTNYPESTVLKTTVMEDGSAKPEKLEAEDVGTIDFAALPFWLPFIELKEGMKFRVPYYRAQLNEIDGLPIYVKEQKIVSDSHGKKHKVWNIQVMSIGGGALTEFWISEKAPYFLGWNFRLVRSGKPVSTMTYNKHWIMDR